MSPSSLRFAAGAVVVAVGVALTGCAGEAPENGAPLDGVSEEGDTGSVPKISPPEGMEEKKTGVATPPEGLEDRKTAVVGPRGSDSDNTKPATSTPSAGSSSKPATHSTQAPQPKPAPPAPATPSAPPVTTPPLAQDNNTSGWTEYKTLNGTASLRAPGSWGKPVIAGEWVEGHTQGKMWTNAIQWSPVPGKNWSFSYADTPYTDTGVCLPKTDYQVVESVDANYMLQPGTSTKLGGLAVARWAEKDSGAGKWIANVALVTSGGDKCQPSPGTIVNDKAVYASAFSEGLAFDNQQAAVNWLASAEGTLAMNAIETLKLYNVAATTAPTPAP